ncbi:MAG: hypothetical protein ACPGFA_12000, partial [Pikeienuella sp.]
KTSRGPRQRRWGGWILMWRPFPEHWSNLDLGKASSVNLIIVARGVTTPACAIRQPVQVVGP